MTVMNKGKTDRKVSKHLSIKKKKKSKFSKKAKKEFRPTGKRGRLVVRNLPFKCNENELHKHFSSFGEIKDIHLLRRPDNKLVGCGFLEYSSRLNADKAIEQLNGKPFLGRVIYVEKSVSREKYGEVEIEKKDYSRIEEESDNDCVDNELNESEVNEEPESGESAILDELEENKEETTPDKNGGKPAKKIIQDKRKNDKISKKERKGRLIIRNLSFRTTEVKLHAHFSQFGEISEVKLLRRPDDTLVGCGFIQFIKKLAAAKAIHHCSGKPFLGRPIIVDWAVAKDKFEKMQVEATKKEIKEEVIVDDENKPSDLNSAKNKVEPDENSGEESESSDSEKEEEESDDSSKGSSNDDDYDNKEDEEINIKHTAEKVKRQRVEDVDEGKTVFVKNLPFSATDEDLLDCMKQYGPVQYALICKDKLTEHSKGSGFVKFKDKEDAEKCLAAGTELTLKGSILDPHPALKRSEVMQKKSKEKKDNRNLYLIKEGIIIAGTPAARGVSVPDMERRLQLEQWKTTRLRNLNMFVSRNRLVIHNLPPTLSDKQLYQLFQKHAGPNALIKEARVMRDLKHLDPSGRGVSKGHGFVSFEMHEDALKALRSINNNPNIFTPTSRPIVAFSIENRSVLNTKTKRMVSSRLKNPLCKQYKPEETEKGEIPRKKPKLSSVVDTESQREPEYAGITAKPGAAMKMRQKYKLKHQAQQHVQDVKKQKQEIKISRKTRRIEHIKKKQVEKKTSKQKKNFVDSDSAFTKLVDKYKAKLLSQASKKKWYDE